MPKVKLYQNLKDNLHCFQAVLKMVLDFFDNKYSFKKLDKITGFKKDKWTWSTKGLIYLSKKYKIIDISNFDFKRFAHEGEKYLKWYYTPSAYKEQSKYSDFIEEQKLIKKLIKSKVKLIEKERVRVSDIEGHEDYLVIAFINDKILDGLKGYNNHSVVITKISDKCVYYNNPGLPAKKRRVKKNLFNKAINDEVILIKKK